MSVRPKKHLGQHFLKDESVSKRIAAEIKGEEFNKVLEIGPGMGALTKYLLNISDYEVHVMEIDAESVRYLKQHFSELAGRIHESDFLKTDLKAVFGDEPFAVAGNFPYNISTEILFKVLEYKEQVPLVVGMFQKEVAERIAEAPGSKKYGITSVLIQAYYDVEYLFTVDEDVFIPPPKVKSGVIKLRRNQMEKLPCDEKLFIRIVKASFNQRRKTLRNSLKSVISGLNKELNLSDEVFSKRPETMSVEDFIKLTKQFQV